MVKSKRKTPTRHTVSGHERSGKYVSPYVRGEGIRPQRTKRVVGDVGIDWSKETKKEKLNRLMKKYGVKEVTTTEKCVVPSKACSPVKYSLEGISYVICGKHLPDILDRLDRTDWIWRVGPKMEK